MYNSLAREFIQIADYTYCRKGLSSVSMNRIREIRKSKKWSQGRLGDIINTSADEISKLERGERRLTLDWMNKIARALDCKPADLISTDEIETTPAHPITDYVMEEAYILFRPIINRRKLTLEQEKRFLKVLQKTIARELSKTGRVTLSEVQAEGILEDAILDGGGGTDNTPTPAPTLP